eukprot:9407298-Pyramimonas_sp.AAC.1
MATPESLVMPEKMAASSNTARCSEAVGLLPLPFPAAREERKSKWCTHSTSCAFLMSSSSVA